MSARTTIDLIQAVNRGVSGVNTAPTFARYPLTADTIRLPMVLTWPGEGTWTRQGFAGKKRDDTVYIIMVFVSPIGQGELPQRSSLAVELRDAFRETWLSVDAQGYPTALQDPSDSDPKQVTLEFDGSYPQVTEIGAIAPLKVGGTDYTGFELRIKVREEW